MYLVFDKLARRACAHAIAEQDRRDGEKSTNRKWMQERAVNEWATENRPELMKAMRAVAHEQKR